MMDFIKNIPWLTIITFTGAFFAAGVSFTAILNAFVQYGNRSRSRLKNDIEILKHFDVSDPSYDLIKSSVDKRVKKIYSEKVIVYRWPELIFGIIYFLVFAIWGYNIYLKNGASFGFIILTIYCFNGLTFIIDSFIEKSFWISK